jgi:hypothetical protein
MQVKEAIALARQYVTDVFSGETITNIGLEELEFDDDKNIWSITLGFSRPWQAQNVQNTLAALVNPRRDYKVIRISDRTKKVLSVKNREPVA